MKKFFAILIFVFGHISLKTAMVFPAAAQQPYGYASNPHDIFDRDALLLLKGELEVAKDILIQIRDTQNRSLVNKAASSLGRMIKELLYITTAVGLSGGCVVAGVGQIVGWNNIQTLLNTNEGKGVALIALPIFVISSIVTYSLLKLIFGRLLSSPEDVTKADIKEALQLVDLTLNKLTYEINKIERLCNERSRLV